MSPGMRGWSGWWSRAGVESKRRKGDSVLKTARCWVVVLFLVAAGFVLPGFARAENLPVVSKAEALAHQISRLAPIYPAIAKVAHIEGTVVLRVVIAANGKVKSVRAISGPAMLRPAAVDQLVACKYRPFVVNGRPAEVVTEVDITYSLGNPKGIEDGIEEETDQQVSMQYFPVDRKCRSALQQQDTKDALQLCKEEVAIAAQFPKLSERSMETLDAHENYGRALLLDHEPKKARKQFDRSIKLAKRFLHKSDVEYAYTYVWRGLSNEMAGDDKRALQDYSTGEDSLKLAIKDLPVAKARYTKGLISVYRIHAALLKRLGKSVQATAIEEQAQKLQ
jgi:TonB family protein